jgi:hypothetical protein
MKNWVNDELRKMREYGHLTSKNKMDVLVDYLMADEEIRNKLFEMVEKYESKNGQKPNDQE